MSAGDVSPEEVRWKDVAEQRLGQKQPFALAQELQQAVAAKQQDLEDMLRVSACSYIDVLLFGMSVSSKCALRRGVQCRL
jgi:hypothetical protein